MGKRGPKPKPAHEKKLAGNPGKRPIGLDLKPKLGVPEMPEWLLPVAKDKWREVVPLVVEMGVLALADGTLLAAYCQVYARWRDAEEKLDEQGTEIETTFANGDSKGVMTSPQVGIAAKWLDKLNQLGAQFGLSPTSRSRINLPPPAEEKDDKDKFLEEAAG